MQTISLINIKGEVGKTTSTLALAQLLSSEYGKRVLVVDADKQANSTVSLTGSSAAELTTADLLTSKEPIARQAILSTAYGVDLIPAGFGLMEANKSVMLDSTRPQQMRLKKQLATIADNYDYCLIDCPPDINMSVVNALAMTDDVLVPVRADRYGLDGLSYVSEAIGEIKDFNPSLRLSGCFLTMYQRGTNLSEYSSGVLEELGVPAMKTVIRQCVKVGEATFGEPIMSYAPHCTAAEDYRALVKEYLEAKEN